MTPLRRHSLSRMPRWFNLLGQQQGVGTGGAQNRGLQVHHHLQLLFRVARPHGNGHGAQPFGAQLEADAGGPQAVARRYLDAVGAGDARRFVAARELDGPVGHVLLRVRNDDRRARRARRRVDAHHFLVGNRLQAQRVGVAQVVLFGEGQLLEVLLSLHVGQVDVGELGRIEGAALLQGCELAFDEVELLGCHLHEKPLSGAGMAVGKSREPG